MSDVSLPVAAIAKNNYRNPLAELSEKMLDSANFFVDVKCCGVAKTLHHLKK